MYCRVSCFVGVWSWLPLDASDRNLWSKAIGLSKRSMDEKEACQRLQASASQVTKLTDLLQQAGEYGTKAEQVQPILLAARACCRALDVQTACKDMTDPDAMAKCETLKESLGACSLVMKEKFGNTAFASDFFQSIFKEDSESPFLFPTNEEFDWNILLRELIIEGEVQAEVLREDEAAHLLLGKCASALKDFEEKLGTDKFTACCKLYAVFKELIGQFGKLTEPSWTVHIQDAGRRFFKIIDGNLGVELVLSFCKGKGHKECVQTMNNAGTLPPTFAKFKEVVGSFEVLNAVDEKLPPSEDHKEVSKHLTNLVTILSLDVQIVKALYPDCHTKIDAYQCQVVANIIRTLNKMKVDMREAQKKLDTFSLTRKQKLRPILEAASVWSLDNVKWMLADDDEKVDKPTGEIVDLYVASDPFLKYVKKIISVIKGAKIEAHTIMDPAQCMKGVVEALKEM